jgi:cytochrome c peroxidase
MRLALITSLIALGAACSGGEAPAPAPAPAPEVVETPAPPPEPPIPAAHLALFTPIKASTVAPTDKGLVDLGRTLYYDTRLSAGRDISCNSCHLLDKYGVDGTPTSTGHKAQKGGRNAPTVYNAFGHIAQFWDGRAANLVDQAKGPVLNPIEMAMPSEKALVELLTTIPGYQSAFARAFPAEPEPISYDNVARAIAAFEEHLSTPSRFDEYLNGKFSALTEDERKGLDTFIATGCTACHTGAFIGGGMYQKIGLVVPYPTKDKGRSVVTKNKADDFMFKVPSLRNIAETGPYFHDGSVATLEDAVRLMGKHQLDKQLDDATVGSIVTFLKSLTGTIDQAYISQPELPVDGPNTPKL